MISFDGQNKEVTLDTDLTWDFNDIHVAAQDWAALSENMKYTLPVSSAGKAPLGGGVYTDIIYTLGNGWKLKPSGYSNGDTITVLGTLITDDSSSRIVAPSTGGVPQWTFQVATYGTVSVVSADGSTTDYSTQLNRIESTVNDNQALILAT